MQADRKTMNPIFFPRYTLNAERNANSENC